MLWCGSKTFPQILVVHTVWRVTAEVVGCIAGTVYRTAAMQLAGSPVAASHHLRLSRSIKIES